MLIKIKDNAINISGLLVLAGILIADNMYANHCKKKSYEKLLSSMVNEPKEEKEEAQ